MDSLILLTGRTAKELCFVASVLQRIGVAYALIGANALLLHGIQLPRTTRDLDFIVAVEDSFQRVRQALLKQGFRHGKIPHRFYTPQGTQVDVLPITKRAIGTGFIEFPDGERLTTLGFSEALKHAEEKPVGDCVVSVAPLPILVALKILAATRRHGPDLQDVVACMKQYEEQGARRFDDVIYTAGLTFETAGAYLLGRDLASMMLAKTLTAIEQALMAFTRDVQLSGGMTDREELDSLLRAFASGVGLESL
jgi:predicted nucleotidyltransferase